VKSALCLVQLDDIPEEYQKQSFGGEKNAPPMNSQRSFYKQQQK